MSWFSNFLGGGMPGAIGGAAGTYERYLQEALNYLRQQEAGGEAAIRGGVGQAIGYQQPYMQMGGEALGALGASLGLPGTTAPGAPTAQDRFRESPGYQFALQQGLQATQRQMGPGGLTGSGAEQRALQRYGTGLAEQQYGQYQTRLGQLAGMGQTAAGTAGQFAYGGGMGIGQQRLGYAGLGTGLYGELGRALAEAQMAQERARQEGRGGFWGGIGGLLGRFAGHFL
jgi:hypothetical protein